MALRNIGLTITWILCGAWGSFTEIWKRPIVKLEGCYTVLRPATKHTTRVVLLCALGGGAIGNFLGSLGGLCSSVSSCALHLVLPGNHVVFQWTLSSMEAPGQHTPFECSNSPLVCAIVSSRLYKELRRSNNSEPLSHNRHASERQNSGKWNGVKKRLRTCGNSADRNFSIVYKYKGNWAKDRNPVPQKVGKKKKKGKDEWIGRWNWETGEKISRMRHTLGSARAVGSGKGAERDIFLHNVCNLAVFPFEKDGVISSEWFCIG